MRVMVIVRASVSDTELMMRNEIAISVTRTAMTIMSSMSVKPRFVMRPLPRRTR